jgi:protoheme IX farnesyltransferase
MLPVVEPDGESTARRVVLCSLAMIPVSLLPALLGMAGALYTVAAIAAGAALLYFGARLGRERTLARAHGLLLATVLYLPALLGVMVIDRRVL